MRKALLTLAFALLFAAPSMAQRIAVRTTTVGNLPATCEPDTPILVTDGTDGTDCSTGSGSTQHWCICNSAGNGYNAHPTAAGNNFGTIGTATADSAADSMTAGNNDGLGLSTTTTNDPEDISIDFDYTLTLAGNPAFAVDECSLVSTVNGGGFICEGSVDNTNEQLYLFPDVDGADTTDEITTNDATQTLTNKTLTTPSIGDFSNATHDHADAAGGGDVALGSGSTATTAAGGDNDTSIATTAFVQGELVASEDWDAFEIQVDGTQCQEPFGQQINSGPIQGAIFCADNAASILYGSMQNEDYQGGTLVFTLLAYSANATPSNTIDFDFACQCRGDSDTINSTWGTAQNAAITFDTQYDLEHADTAAATCNGTCAAGDTVFWRAVMDAATTDAVTDTYLLGVSVQEQ
jgi:hypothetical protein